MKRKILLAIILVLSLLVLFSYAFADNDPIVANMEVSPNRLIAPGPVTVTITISNSGENDLRDPVVLYDPAASLVSDFGTNGAAILKAGESKTWTGSYNVNDRTLENGSIVYYLKYTLYKESGEAVAQSKPIRAAVSRQEAETDIDVKRTISPNIAQENQEITVKYDITNTGTVNVQNLTIQENSDIYKKKIEIEELKPGQTAQIPFKVKMGKKDLTSNATISYSSELLKKPKTYNVEKATIRYGKPSLNASLTSSVKGVTANGMVTLNITIKNDGNVDYSDVRVSDSTLGDIFSNQEVKAGKSLNLEKEITIPASTTFQFTVLGTDESGTEASVVTNELAITAVDPEDALHLVVNAIPDNTEVFSNPGPVRFTISILNDSNVEARNVVISHGSTEIYKFDSIASGEVKTLSRDTLLSMAGKYQFTATAQDPLESKSIFSSNEIRIAFSSPTAAPATSTPIPDPTPEPTFAPATIPPANDPRISPAARTVQSIARPVMFALIIIFAVFGGLFSAASLYRRQQRKASENAVDVLERTERRDYSSESDTIKPENNKSNSTAVDVIDSSESKNDNSEYELPHMKYAREAVEKLTSHVEEIPDMDVHGSTKEQGVIEMPQHPERKRRRAKTDM